ncbi:SDR family oxidoreductase [Pedobacter hartonius]|uniref:NAD(P)-dependent dehydrogenase, short-chain alcohol dehydrogenase family n=1 Tax=Pedobacter hartonius TaxID=425514 RepID=A0A1H4CN56_9SPHI|nr:SDR family oxidoreductase [Pedobacter hartonius]SEA61886.1 NAD(P)-dependent dehydrogenase, short-chain alcohol dehydrogenase family [Pedobacter hartonius]
MKNVLITGANKSIGLETARQLLKQGYYVFLGSRDLKNGQDAVEMLNAEGLNEVESVKIDITNQESINNARTEIGRKTEVLDALINNAGMSGGSPQAPSTVDLDVMNLVFDTNFYGAVRVTQAFIDLLEKSKQPRIVNVSSGLGSLTLSSDPNFKYHQFKGGIYGPSKAALNMYTIALAYELREKPFKVNAVDPGFTATDFNNHLGTGNVNVAGARIAKYVLIGEDGPTGKFISEEMNPETGEIPW